jgi:uncharacterized RDD family membrane protein YckC
MPGQEAGSLPSSGGTAAYQQAGGGIPEQPSGPAGMLRPVDPAETRVVGHRVVQYIIDYILSGIIPGLAYWLLDGGGTQLHAAGWAVATIISVVWLFWYWVIRPYRHDGQTFGMQLLGIRVTSKVGGPASMGQLFVRAVFLIIDDIVFGLVGLITMLCSRYRQRVGDHVAGTLVVHRRMQAGPAYN